MFHPHNVFYIRSGGWPYEDQRFFLHPSQAKRKAHCVGFACQKNTRNEEMPVNITLFRSITMFCGTNNISCNIPKYCPHSVWTIPQNIVMIMNLNKFMTWKGKQTNKQTKTFKIMVPSTITCHTTQASNLLVGCGRGPFHMAFFSLNPTMILTSSFFSAHSLFLQWIRWHVNLWRHTFFKSDDQSYFRVEEIVKLNQRLACSCDYCCNTQHVILIYERLPIVE